MNVSPAALATARAAEVHAACLAEVEALDAAFRAMGASPRLMAPWAHFTRGLRDHFSREEAEVFPAIVALSEGRAPAGEGFAGPLHDLRFELDELRTISDALGNAAPEAGPHEARLLALLDTLEEHARREEQELFPLAMDLLARWERGEEPAEEPAAADPVARQRQVEADRAWTHPLEPGHHARATALPPGDEGLAALLALRRGLPVRLLPLSEGLDTLPGRAARARAEDAWPLVLADPADPADLPALRAAGAELGEVLLCVGDPAGAALRREALALLRAAGVRVSLALRPGPEEALEARLSEAWGLVQRHDHVRELLVLGPQDPGELVERLAAVSASLDPAETRRFNRALGALRAAFHVERPVFALHELLLRGPRGGLQPLGARVDLRALDAAATAYTARAARHPQLARARLLRELVTLAREPGLARAFAEGLRLQLLFRMGAARRSGFVWVDFARQG